MTPRRAAPLALLLILLSSRAVSAAGPELEVSVGFDNLFRQDAHSSLGVLLRSPDSPLEGELIVEYDAGTALKRTGHIRISRPVSLPADVSGVYRFTMPLRAGTYPLTVRVERHGVLVVRSELELRPMLARGPVVVGLSRKPSLDALIPPLAELTGTRPELRYPRVEYLPVDPRGWDGADLVLWHDLPVDAPDPDAGRALAAWVASGGLLAIFNGPWNVGRSLPPAFGTLTVPGDGGAVAFGRGTVLFLPPELSPAGSREAAAIVAALAASGTFGGSMELRRSVESAVRRIRKAAFVSEDAVAGPSGRFLVIPVIYVLIAAGILIVGMKMSGGRWLQLASLLAVAAVCSVVVFLLPESRHEDPRIRRLNMVVAPDGGPVFRREELILYSPRGRGSDLPLTDGQLPVPDPGGRYRLAIGPGGPVLEQVSLEPWHPRDISLEELRIRSETDRTGGPAAPAPPQGGLWKDVVLVADGEVQYLAGEWDGGVLPDAPDRDAPYPGDGSGAYAALAQRLAAQPGGDPMVLARGDFGRDGSLTLLVIPEVSR